MMLSACVVICCLMLLSLKRRFARSFSFTVSNSLRLSLALVRQLLRNWPDQTLVPNRCLMALRHLCKEDPNGPMVCELLIEGQPLRLIVDTGASDSFLSREAVGQLSIAADRITKDQEPTMLANGIPIPTSKTEALEVARGPLRFTHSFRVLKNLRYIGVIGRDLLPKLGISVHGLSLPGKTQQRAAEQKNDDNILQPLREAWSEEDYHPSRPAILTAIEADLQANAELRPHDNCNLPYAVVHLPTEDGKTSYRPQYPLPQSQLDALDQEVQQWLNDQVIVPAPYSPWHSPVLAVPKKDEHGKSTLWRPCLDVRALNALLLVDTPNNLPNIDVLTRELAGFALLSEIDLAKGYHQLLVAPADRVKTTFSWRGKRYMFRGAPFGIKHLPSFFQMVISTCLAETETFTKVYLDNIYVHSSTQEDHVAHLKVVIQRLTDANLRIKRAKSHFGFIRGSVLGHLVGGTDAGNSITMAKDKVTNIHQKPRPTTGKQVSAWLGMCNYLRRFIPLYSTISAPLEPLRKVKDVTPRWTAECEEAWLTLRRVIGQAPALTQPNYAEEFKVATDASNVGIGAVLYQEYDDARHYVSFQSTSLAPHQKAYPVTLKELLAIIYALRKYHVYLYGRKFELYTDHRALVFLMDHRNRSLFLENWVSVLFNYEFEIIHRPGVRMVLPDALSRLYPERAWSERAAQARELLTLPVDGPVRYPNHELHSFISERFNKSATPPNALSQHEFVSQTHAQSHRSGENLFKDVWNAGYYWPKLRAQCSAAAGSCRACLRFMVRQSGFHPLTPLSAALPFTHIAIDAGDFNIVANGFALFHVVVDLCTRFLWIFPVKDNSMESTVTSLLSLFSTFGVPAIIQSDNGREYVNQLVARLNATLGVVHRTITPHHPRGNGTAERHVGLVKSLIRKLAGGDLSRWDSHVPMAQMAINTRVSKRHGSTPFSLMFGRKFIAESGDRPLMSAEDLIKRHEEIRAIVFPMIDDKTKAYNKQMKKQHDKAKKIIGQFPLGAMVMLKRDELMSKGTLSKNENPYSGPFKVVRASPGGSYWLLDPANDLHPSPVAPERLQLIKSSVDPENSYDVVKITDHRGPIGKREYRIRWKGCSPREDTWEPESNINDLAYIKQYWDVHTQKRRLPKTLRKPGERRKHQTSSQKNGEGSVSVGVDVGDHETPTNNAAHAATPLPSENSGTLLPATTENTAVSKSDDGLLTPTSESLPLLRRSKRLGSKLKTVHRQQ